MKKTLLVLSVFMMLSFPVIADVILYPVKNKENKYGYINVAGKQTVEFKYEEAKDFSEGFGAVKKGGKWGYIDARGKETIAPAYNVANPFSEGLASVTNSDGFYGYIDASGNTVINYTYIYGGNFSEGLARVQNPGAGLLFGYIDKTGAYVVKPKYDYKNPPRDFKQGLAAVYEDKKWGFIDVKGDEVIKPQYFEVSDFGNSLAAVQEITVSYVIPELTKKSGDGTEWTDRGIKADTGGKIGFIDTTGSIVIKPQYSSSYGFSDGLAPVEVDGKWGYISPAGEMVIAPQFSFAGTFKEGAAHVTLPGKNYTLLHGFIDTKGAYILKPADVFNVADFSNGLALVIKQDNSLTYVDKTGKTVWKSSK